ncbi:aspartyl protease family protein At5g10770 [Pyrus x bretschneideri]|uniref:aspartyl protease family protein At5g10770 n=1 Tax=Pyrus x bretschneideri TaxID=225117 RepID=UPI0005112BB7|nr:aspartyl protease family protein At5g10770 [Pyrus x bretschneideri]
MATPIPSSSSFLRFSIGLSAFLCLILCSLAVRDTKTNLPSRTYTVEVISLLPANTCRPSTNGHDNKAASVLKVIHKHGPCNQVHQLKSNSNPSDQDEYHIQILKQDEARVHSIHSHFNDPNNNYKIPDPLAQSDATVIPAQSGSVLGSGNYIVSVGLGSPQKQLSLVFDTGSGLTWTQCRPCAGSCYQQKDPIFDPSLSTSYSNISCNSAACSQLAASGVASNCSGSTCIYGQGYGDRSFTIGFLASEKLTLTSTDVFTGFVFGCGQNNQGLFRGIAGLIGLDRSKISLVEQTAQKYNRFFSYCLPSTSSSTGYLSLGNSDNGRSGNAVKFTPLTRLSQDASFYGLGLVGINIGGSQLPISASVFSTSGTIIDSGTVITRLPATAYTALRDAFREAMKRYPTAKPISSLLDTCYDFSGFKTITLPTIGFVFGNGVTVDVDETGILVQQRASQFCLAFAGNKDDRSVGIIGNVQQKRLQVVYDVAGGKVGFAPAGCQ